MDKKSGGERVSTEQVFKEVVKNAKKHWSIKFSDLIELAGKKAITLPKFRFISEITDEEERIFTVIFSKNITRIIWDSACHYSIEKVLKSLQVKVFDIEEQEGKIHIKTMGVNGIAVISTILDLAHGKLEKELAKKIQEIKEARKKLYYEIKSAFQKTSCYEKISIHTRYGNGEYTVKVALKTKKNKPCGFPNVLEYTRADPEYIIEAIKLFAGLYSL